MNEKQRRQDLNPTDCGAEPSHGGCKLAQAREEASAFLAAADDAINSALSTDSTKFNQSARQEGGE